MEKAKRDPGHAVLAVEFREGLKIRHYSQGTIKLYFEQVIQFLLWVEKTLDKRVQEIAPQDILNYEQHLRQKGLKVNSVHRYLHSVKRFFKWLEEKLYMLINPYENLVIPRPIQNEPVVLTEKEVVKVLNQPNTSTPLGIRDRAILEVFYASGIRIGELNNLTIFDIDTTNGFLRINKGKFAKDRFAPLTRAACHWLKEYINNVRPRLTKNQPRENALFVGKLGKKLHKMILTRLVRDYGQAAAINKKVTAHTFRHTFASHMLNGKADIVKVQQLLGHRHISVTQKYTHVTDKEIKQEHAKYHPRDRSRTNDYQ